MEISEEEKDRQAELNYYTLADLYSWEASWEEGDFKL